jgi:hypothetical protein
MNSRVFFLVRAIIDLVLAYFAPQIFLGLPPFALDIVIVLFIMLAALHILRAFHPNRKRPARGNADRRL